MKNKKAQLGAFEIFFSLTMIFAIAIFVVILSHSWNKISPPLETALNSALPEGETSFNLSTMNSKISGGVTMFNLMFPFIIIGLIIFSLISAFLSRNNPAFLFVSILILAVAVLLAVVFSNTYQALITGTGLQTEGNAFSVIKLFMKGLPIIIGVVSAITIFALFAIGRGGRATGGL